MPTKHNTAPVADAGAPGGFNQQTQDYYGAQSHPQQDVNQYPEQQQQQQAPYGTQEMPSPEHAQVPPAGAPYPADNTTPYPNQTERQI